MCGLEFHRTRSVQTEKHDSHEEFVTRMYSTTSFLCSTMIQKKDLQKKDLIATPPLNSTKRRFHVIRTTKMKQILMLISESILIILVMIIHMLREIRVIAEYA